MFASVGSCSIGVIKLPWPSGVAPTLKTPPPVLTVLVLLKPPYCFEPYKRFESFLSTKPSPPSAPSQSYQTPAVVRPELPLSWEPPVITTGLV